jgi:hypothetical protein
MKEEVQGVEEPRSNGRAKGTTQKVPRTTNHT